MSLNPTFCSRNKSLIPVHHRRRPQLQRAIICMSTTKRRTTHVTTWETQSKSSQ